MLHPHTEYIVGFDTAPVWHTETTVLCGARCVIIDIQTPSFTRVNSLRPQPQCLAKVIFYRERSRSGYDKSPYPALTGYGLVVLSETLFSLLDRSNNIVAAIFEYFLSLVIVVVFSCHLNTCFL